MMSNSLVSLLQISDFVVDVHLGCTPEERIQPQEVRFSADIGFLKEPEGVFSDQLDETVCYAEICEIIKEKAQSREYQLVEKLAKDCLVSLRDHYPKQAIRLTVHKVKPPIDRLQKGVKYICGDLSG